MTIKDDIERTWGLAWHSKSVNVVYEDVINADSLHYAVLCKLDGVVAIQGVSLYTLGLTALSDQLFVIKRPQEGDSETVHFWIEAF